MLAGLVGGIIAPTVAVAAQPPAEIVSRDVEAAFRSAMEMWAYREFWRLWEVSTSQSRFTTTQQEFAALMERGNTRPAAGRQIEDLRITPTSAETALVLARVGLEDPGTNTVRSLVRSFLFYYQDGRWRPQLSDFLGLASYTFPLPPVNSQAILVLPCCPGLLALPSSPKVIIVAPCCPARTPAPRPQLPVLKP
jgi:hypothetical protein